MLLHFNGGRGLGGELVTKRGRGCESRVDGEGIGGVGWSKDRSLPQD